MGSNGGENCRVGMILEMLNGIAPFELAEPWDNVGLLSGSVNNSVTKILCGLDLTDAMIDRAQELGCEMIVTHHPILFRGRKNLCEDDAEGRMLTHLVRSGIAMAAMHTNFDNMHPGVNDALAAKLGLADTFAAENGMVIGSVPPMTLEAFVRETEELLGDVVRVYGEPQKTVSKVAVLGGAGGDFAPAALAQGADVYITGEIGYHKGCDAAADGLCVLEAGHRATERPAITLLADRLQKQISDVQYNVNLFVHTV